MPSQRPSFPVSAIVLGLGVALAALASGAASLTTAPPTTPTSVAVPSASCVTLDQANPIAARFPANVTGVLNVTLAVVPIPLVLARQLVPSGLAILESAYLDAIPGFPKDMYPVLVQAGHDHDIRIQGFNVDDFSRAGFEFPFIDRLGDGETPFRWAPEQLMTATNAVAIAGSEMYGTVVHAADFEPGCDAYGRAEDGSVFFRATGTVTAAAAVGTTDAAVPASTAPLLAPFMDLSFSPMLASAAAYPLSVYRTLLHQPVFADPAGLCDSMTRFLDTSLTTAPEFAPVSVVGRVRSNLAPLAGTQDEDDDDDDDDDNDDDGEGQGKGHVEYEDVQGLLVASAFVENNYLDCREAMAYMSQGV